MLQDTDAQAPYEKGKMMDDLLDLFFRFGPFMALVLALAVIATVYAVRHHRRNQRNRAFVRTTCDLETLVKLAEDGKEFPDHLVHAKRWTLGGMLPSAPGLDNEEEVLRAWLKGLGEKGVLALARLALEGSKQEFHERAIQAENVPRISGLRTWLRSFFVQEVGIGKFGLWICIACIGANGALFIEARKAGEDTLELELPKSGKLRDVGYYTSNNPTLDFAYDSWLFYKEWADGDKRVNTVFYD